MNIRLDQINTITETHIELSGSKSETNRILLLQTLFPAVSLHNISNADDTQIMQQALQSKESIINIHHAGTAMRFLTAYFAMQDGREVVLTGSERMKERPVKILVDALRKLGATIEYTENEGYPPLCIKGKSLKESNVTIKADVSSQYITALLLIGAKLPKGITITLAGGITSLPYIEMTLGLLNSVGIQASLNNNILTVAPVKELKPITLTAESDWSSASYYYAVIALSPVDSKISLSSFKQSSLQGDSALVAIYKNFGVETAFRNGTIILTKVHQDYSNTLELDLKNTPDIAQTIAVTCFGLNIKCKLTGLHTLKIKETDRLEALKTELEKFGATVTITEDSLSVNGQKANHTSQEVAIDTYNDHRMAMAFAPLALKYSFTVNDAEVVSKSYPDFWEDLKKAGFSVAKV
ncbi:3-phosphoshikimate 1-carboxyvinyltransferase [Flavobacterium suaedae]|uniref:3-phosphoshikimate 1-carboxyvinyltransferase n=1 Tax=Flavobacterium suaedae TaxID=1767027 RepID=A0ABQ1JJU4_9FLAO|nr:3-phosphoshikimate 1-carboxyvinyltransferase [Flavobacterium suaedae]GGB70840.1 3-phosphoshikimate 1-carboxyvinyltransferase [Flavobacterium suaedae]